MAAPASRFAGRTRSLASAAIVLLLAASLGSCTDSGEPDPGPVGTSAIPHGPLDLALGPLEATRYRAGGFAVPVSFEVGEGWAVEELSERFFSLERSDVAVSFAFLESTSPDDLRRDLKSAGLEVSEPEAGDVGGVPSERWSIAAPDRATILYETDAGSHRLAAGSAATLTLVPLSDGLLAITIEAPESEIESATGEVDFEILATIRIESPAG